MTVASKILNNITNEEFESPVHEDAYDKLSELQNIATKAKSKIDKGLSREVAAKISEVIDDSDIVELLTKAIKS